jgi:hypothetical protein
LRAESGAGADRKAVDSRVVDAGIRPEEPVLHTGVTGAHTKDAIRRGHVARPADVAKALIPDTVAVTLRAEGPATSEAAGPPVNIAKSAEATAPEEVAAGRIADEAATVEAVAEEASVHTLAVAIDAIRRLHAAAVEAAEGIAANAAFVAEVAAATLRTAEAAAERTAAVADAVKAAFVAEVAAAAL